MEDKATASVVSRLALLVLKRKKTFSESPPEGSNKLRAFEYLKSAAPQTTAIELWPCIIARTSEIYASVEGFLPLFKDAIKKLASEIGLTEADIELAPTLKDPVRVSLFEGAKGCFDRFLSNAFRLLSDPLVAGP